MENKQIVGELLHGVTPEAEYERLRDWHNLKPLSNAGNRVVDYFTLEERLNTRMKSNLSFYDFLRDFDTYITKEGIRRLYDQNPEHHHVIRARNAYKLYFGNPTIFKPLLTIRILNQLPECKTGLLDPTMGWGGRAVGTSILNIPKYIGIDSNHNLEEPYKRLVEFLRERSNTEYQLIFRDCLEVEYSTLEYDAIVTSYPYYNIERYSHYKQYNSKRKMNEGFFKPLTTRIYDGLKAGGYMALNVNPEIYDFIKTFMGQCCLEIPIICRNRNTKYRESVYVWFKPL